MRKKATKRPTKRKATAPQIEIRGARQNNLKGFDLDIPLNQLTVVTGPSGSGKSSLAFQTIYAEGQRRYVETFSPYTRQFFDRMDKPQVDEIRGIPPAIAIEQQNGVRTTRSTVGTITEINDYLKLLFPRLATATCPECDETVRPETPKSVADRALKDWAKRTVLVTFGVPVPPKTKPVAFFEFLQGQGYLRIFAFGEIYRADEPSAYKRKTLPAVVPVIQDRVRLEKGQSTRLLEAIEAAFAFGKGQLVLIDPENDEQLAFSKNWHCAACDVTLRAPTPGLFTFNNPLGACPDCRGFGRTIGIDLERALPDKSLSIAEGVVKAFSGKTNAECQDDLLRCARDRDIPTETPFEELSKEHQKWVLLGTGMDPDEAWRENEWYGVRGFFDWMEQRSYKMHVRVFLSRYRAYTTCRACNGHRLQPESLNFRVAEMTLPEMWQLPVDELLPVVEELPRPEGDRTAELIIDEVAARLRYLDRVGLGYLDLDRSTRTLSGGEMQRVSLTTCLGASLVNTLFVLDEPSIGLHPRDTGRLIEVMHHLRDKGNTLVVVEHEEAVIRAADQLVDIGPGRGEGGGELVFQGAPGKIRNSLTADYLTGKKTIPVPAKRRKPKKGNAIKIVRATQNNLKKVDVAIPLGVFCCVTGVSGSGKSTLVHSVLYEHLIRKKGTSSDQQPGTCKDVLGAEKIEHVVLVDQSPLARTPRSTPAVYVGAFDLIRRIFSDLPDAKAEGLTMGYFSFNSGAGRCERCWGNGFEKIEMQFLSDLYIRCPECEGKRYTPDALRIKLDDLSVHDVLELTVNQALKFFAPNDDEKPATTKLKVKICAKLQPLADVGLTYLRLGQPLNTLSGGESQRLKLVGHLLESKGGGKGDLLIFDEPTTGLHFDDIRMLLDVFQRVVDQGNSIIVIEHNLEVIKCADHIIDLGPEAGITGGEILGIGTPEEIATLPESHTGQFLAEMFGLKALPMAAEPVALYQLAAKPTSNNIRITGAREHNLKNITVEIPRDDFVVITGLSGSGKSTLAFDIIFAEGQRRFLDSMSPYARQFVQQMEKPDIDVVTGLPPTVAIEQRITRGGGKSTVATVTEVYHFLRLLFAKVGTQHCPDCECAVEAQSLTAIAKGVRAIVKSGKAKLLAPVVKARKGFHTDIAAWAGRQGFTEMLVDGEFMQVEGFEKLERFKEHSIDVVVGELSAKTKTADLDEILRLALRIGKGTIRLSSGKKTFRVFSSDRSCPECGTSFEELDPRLFSFNSPHGWCKNCRGFGFVHKRARSTSQEFDSQLEAEVEEERRMERADDDEIIDCGECGGSRINTIGRAVHIGKLTIDQVTRQPVADALAMCASLKFKGTAATIACDIIVEITQRLKFMQEVGLGYLSLDRSAKTLSGGEGQRIRLAAQLGSNLRGVLYVLDEPTIGLHPRDNLKLLETLVALRDKGNSVLVVEHDEETMARSGQIIDMGPGAGMYGGEVTAQGSLAQLKKAKGSVTGQYLKDPMVHPVRGERRKLPGKSTKGGWLAFKGASANNLKNIDIAIPLGRLVCISGISGSGKSSLMRGVIKPAVEVALKKNARRPKDAAYKSVAGAGEIGAVYEVDQSPIGKTSRSTPATYIKVFDEIRKLYAALPTSRVRGYTASRFSFNTEGGRCETCKGNGMIKMEMTFLPTSYVLCEDCRGLRYNAPTLEIEYNGKNIGQIMDMTIQEASEFFETNQKVHRPLRLLNETGTGYLKLGQPSPTLSGGEAQRIKLVTQLTRGVARSENAKIRQNRKVKPNLYLIEEPTIGLHMADVRRLIDVLHALVDDGHTVIVIEHNVDVLAEADYLIDIGPEAGAGGGEIVAKGTPEQVKKVKRSRTGAFL